MNRIKHFVTFGIKPETEKIKGASFPSASKNNYRKYKIEQRIK